MSEESPDKTLETCSSADTGINKVLMIIVCVLKLLKL